MLADKKLLITGVITKDSIAWEVARQAQEAGAEVVLTGFGRAKRMTERAAAKLPQEVDVLDLDVNDPEQVQAVADDLRERWGRVDGVLHAIAFAPEDALGGKFLETPPESADAGVPDERVLAEGAERGDAAADGGRRRDRRHGLRRAGRLAGLRLDGRRQGRRSRPSRATWRATSGRRACA